MVYLPEFLNPFKKKGEALLAEHAIGNIEFSGSTYQVQVVDPQSHEEAWAFLQLDKKGAIKDRFCSCEAIEDKSACPHLAAAYLRIFNRKGAPLHERFQRSLWNQLCLLYADACGDDPKIIKEKEKGIFSCRTKGSGKVFTAKGLSSRGETKLREIFVERHEETEETSLKFSNLSEEEINLWRQGRPGSQLRYELSFWNDLAKWLMLMQDEGEQYQIAFTYSPQSIPTEIQIRFADVEVGFHLSENDLPAILSTLSTVNSPLPVHRTSQDSIQRIVYDKDTGKLTIEPREISAETGRKLEEKGLPFGDWWLLPEVGMYSRKEHPLLNKPVLKGREIGKVLNKYFSLIKSKLTDVTISEESVELSYSIQFDADWNLHINGYLFEPGDLSQPYSRFFGDWAYLDAGGFFHLERVVFDEAETVVPCGEVGDFVRQHRAWFNRQEGFAIHITGVETKLNYNLIEEDCILFTRKAMIDEEPTKAKDFGQWVYVKEQGFFSKVNSQAGIPIRSGVKIKAGQIPLFLRMYGEELQLVSGFFSQKSPVAKMGLRIELTGDQTISITPEYKRYPEYEGREIKIFDDYTYVEGEGFHKIPQELLLPVRFRYPIQLEKENFPRFFTYEMEQLRAFATSIDPQLNPPEYLKLIAETLSLEEEGYKLKLHYASDRNTAVFSDIWTAINNNERFFFSEAGLIDLAEDRFKWIAKIKKQQIDRRSNTLTLSTLDLLRLNTFDEIHVEEGQEHLRELIEFRSPIKANISALKSHLRPYQELGLQWLWFLYHHNLSGLLCDDMGLGKTHQAMALMAAVMNYQKEKKHFLVVCPTSVIYHWEEKLNEFLPSVRVCTFHGSNRSLEDFHKEYDVLLTSYGIWRNENAVLRDVLFEVAIFDEIQAAKNQKSRIHTSLLNVKARIRLGLTGTPIENRLRELKALFDIILPNFMPAETEYKQFFVVPIEKENNLERRQFLSRYIKPFVLRRKKEEVLLDLPEKTEEITHCELSADQRLLYKDVLHKVRGGIMRELEDRSAPIPYIHIFSALSSLKQICNHPAAYLKNPLSYPNYRSGKWDLFVELLNEALESGQKVVVFSQYLRMLDIIEQHLHENTIEYATIRGSTLNRGEQIRRFNKDPSCEVFLGSLQAAGLGIDLTAGSVVIHYDRWWNAAREDQATDRVHRIGQTRGVQVFKLVTKGTFEERIDEMILQKGKLMEEVVGVDDHRFMKHFDRDELLQLLKDI